jgi:hypothetical protein
MALFDIVAETALKKLKAMMIEKNIHAYIATLDEKGEMKTEPINYPFVVLPKKDYEDILQLLKTI